METPRIMPTAECIDWQNRMIDDMERNGRRDLVTEYHKLNIESKILMVHKYRIMEEMLSEAGVNQPIR